MFTKTIETVVNSLKNLFDGESGFIVPKTEEINDEYCRVDMAVSKLEAARNLKLN